MLHDKLKKVESTKTNYHNLQLEFYKELKTRFPFIMEASMAKVTNELEKELQLLLCNALKYESVKIPLESHTAGYSNDTKTIVNVQRGQPGFYYPNSERGVSDIFYMNLQNYITDKDDMNHKSETTDYQTKKVTKKDQLIAKLSDLRHSKQSRRIESGKLETYFKLMKEVMAYREKFLCYIEEGQHNGLQRRFLVDNLAFTLNARSFDIQFLKAIDKEEEYYHNYSNHNGFQYRMSNDDMYHLLDYSAPESRDYSKHVHRKLEIFISNYRLIRAKLDYEEAAKKKAYEKCQDFLKQIRVHTLPFKVLKELKK